MNFWKISCIRTSYSIMHKAIIIYQEGGRVERFQIKEKCFWQLKIGANSLFTLPHLILAHKSQGGQEDYTAPPGKKNGNLRINQLKERGGGSWEHCITPPPDKWTFQGLNIYTSITLSNTAALILNSYIVHLKVPNYF